ncbi:uncharacterized protein PHACADRAFT_143534 [Phanerochaete carnosa HHB-10118-sp]|uniref:PQ-loop-domain-containing protein n=1 Tax=Phanerochaete carnosa (strain HHB-10118-sp) TaxID=650164 RepID=K5W8Q3_PHACS|nr:uncharacterized protein PHACADRAFT_143534 [Phanerochaete carnosa HHB-10118-sp]EKM55334.1 hypothetical protein PHACADRAFT_143534 [Phanerochaete carnosa HHB-10118-sp]
MALISSLSDVLGYTSIGCWLGAQFPQVLENLRRRSVNGLAWPFLLNWLLGEASTLATHRDISNLVGCILTHQLPFQTYLAMYFCFVDVTLVGQYLYYSNSAKPRPPLSNRSRAASSATITRIEHPPAHYRALSQVAANVAAAAALAAQQEEQSRWRPHAQASVESRRTILSTDPGEAEDEVDEAALARLADSLYSEGGRNTARKKVSWSRERGGSIGRGRPPVMSPINEPLSTTFPNGPSEEQGFSDRGRPATRNISLDGPQHEWTVESSNRRSSRASRKGAGMVFLGVWALFGIGTLAGSRQGVVTENAIRVGRVLTNGPPSIESPLIPTVTSRTDTLARIVANEAPVPQADASLSYDDLHFSQPIMSTRADDPDDQHDAPSTDYIIGRISAWICTTLYLTSRLPQIWKNYTRKSVEGLSISLFVFAFLGNFFYVFSILTSPNLSLPEREAAAFLKESVPYLLGSGGTLMFDVTIVIQSFLYKPKAMRGRRLSRPIAEEEEGLLATGAEDSITPSRRRMANSSVSDRGE